MRDGNQRRHRSVDGRGRRFDRLCKFHLSPVPTTTADGLQYLAHPPRPLRSAYPPGSLPPPSAIDEIASQLITSPCWSATRSWSMTRARVFQIARMDSAKLLGGARRQPEPTVATLRTAPLGSNGVNRVPINAPIRPKLAVLGGAKMNRQQHSMDSLYGDNEPGTFSEALRLSSTLQNNAAHGANGAGHLTSTESLSSREYPAGSRPMLLEDDDRHRCFFRLGS